MSSIHCLRFTNTVAVLLNMATVVTAIMAAEQLLSRLLVAVCLTGVCQFHANF